MRRAIIWPLDLYPHLIWALHLPHHLIWAPLKGLITPVEPLPQPSTLSCWLGAIPARHSDLGDSLHRWHPGLAPASMLVRRDAHGVYPAPVHAARSQNRVARGHPACGYGVSGMAGAVPVLLRHVGPARRGLTVDYSLCLCISVHNAPHICILQCALN